MSTIVQAIWLVSLMATRPARIVPADWTREGFRMVVIRVYSRTVMKPPTALVRKA